jgi:hypothetical protein
MAFEAPLCEQRPDVTLEVNRARERDRATKGHQQQPSGTTANDNGKCTHDNFRHANNPIE